MIPKPYIAKWQENAPWNEFSQIEQDLIISRTLVEIFSDDFLKENLLNPGKQEWIPGPIPDRSHRKNNSPVVDLLSYQDHN